VLFAPLLDYALQFQCKIVLQILGGQFLKDQLNNAEEVLVHIAREFFEVLVCYWFNNSEFLDLLRRSFEDIDYAIISLKREDGV